MSDLAVLPHVDLLVDRVRTAFAVHEYATVVDVR